MDMKLSAGSGVASVSRFDDLERVAGMIADGNARKRPAPMDGFGFPMLFVRRRTEARTAAREYG
jgi:hypothetical protein